MISWFSLLQFRVTHCFWMTLKLLNYLWTTTGKHFLLGPPGLLHLSFPPFPHPMSQRAAVFVFPHLSCDIMQLHVWRRLSSCICLHIFILSLSFLWRLLSPESRSLIRLCFPACLMLFSPDDRSHNDTLMSPCCCKNVKVVSYYIWY